MIYLKVVKKYCKNYEQIENYQEAINSPRAYHCHHRKETDEKMSQKELIRKKLYYNRPPEELIFLSYEEHLSLHHKGKVWSEKSKKKLSQTRRSNGKSKGSNNPMYGIHRYGSAAPRYKFICPIKLTYMYCKQGKSIKQIAKELGYGYRTIDRHLKELNIKKSK